LRTQHEMGLAGKYSLVSLMGFATDAIVLHLLLWARIEPAWARLVSLACAMNVTFFINGLHVFKCLNRASFAAQWVKYMTTNGFGNFCNYWIFVTLVSTHWPVVSAPMFALGVGSFTAWIMNYAATRFFVFRTPEREIVLTPSGSIEPEL
jgi:putative flippase GtrA